MTDTQPVETDVGTQVLTFVIADVRGYTRFTRERGDAAAAILAKRFADLARDTVEARGGEVIELRGDEALAVFRSPCQAVRAAVDLQQNCAEDTDADGAFPLLVGIGIDTGPAVPVEDGYRGVALNLAARLCSAAGAGQVLTTEHVRDSAGAQARDIAFAERGPTTFKGFDQPINVVEATPGGVRRVPAPRVAHEPQPVPLELSDATPIAGRSRELRWLRGTWRQVRRGTGRIVVVSGEAGIGKTRLAGDLASRVARNGDRVSYAGAGGTSTASAIAALRSAADTSDPRLLVLDDVRGGDDIITAVDGAWDAIAERPALVLILVHDIDESSELAALVSRADAEGDGHRRLMPLDAADIRAVVEVYAGESIDDAPVETFARASRGVPALVHELASDWAEAEATRRLEAAAEFMAATRTRRTADLDFANNVIGLRLGRLYDVPRVHDTGGDDICPYKGLASFSEDDATLFFGRERLVGELAARLVGTGLLMVVGASGSGKSSVLAAGLLPSLRADLLPGSSRWRQRLIRPGDHPLAALRDAVAGPDPERLVLVIDQFEETFTVCASDAERNEFVGELTSLAKEPDRVAVILAMRSDFYGEIAGWSDLAALAADNHVLVGPLTRDELARAITLPARRSALRVESRLVDALVDDAADEPGALPLLSTALVELWQARSSDGWIRMRAYDESGGLRGAVARLADASYEQLGELERAAARRVMLRLSTADGDTVTRRRVAIDEFDVHSDPASALVIERFTQDRLLTREGDTVEVAHEALLREWPRVQQWLADDTQGRQLRQHLTQSARTWQDRGGEPSELYRGARLSAALDWSAEHAADLNDLERSFLGASRDAAERDAEAQRRTNRRLRGLLTGVALLLVLALVAGVVALIQRSSARHAATRAQKAATAALAQSLGAQAVSQPRLDLAMLLARESVALDPTLQTRSDLMTTLLRAPTVIRTLHFNANRNGGLAVSPDGTRLVDEDNDGHNLLIDPATGRQLREFDADVLGYAANGDLLTTASTNVSGSSAGIAIRDPHTLATLRTIPYPAWAARLGVTAGLVGVASHGGVLATVLSHGHDTSQGPKTDSSWLVRFDYATGKVIGDRLTIPIVANTPAFQVLSLPDPNRVLEVSATTTTIVDLRTGTRVRSYPVGSGATTSTADGRTVALAGPGGAFVMLDVATGKAHELVGADPHASAMVFTPDGKSFASGDEDGRVLVWDVASGSLTATLTGHGGPVHALAVSPNGSTLFSGSFDNNVNEWDLTGRRGFPPSFDAVPTDPSQQAWSLSVSPDSRTAAVGSTSGDVALWDLRTRQHLMTWHAADGLVSAVQFGPGGRTVMVAADVFTPGQQRPNPQVRLWSLGAKPELLREMTAPARTDVTWAAISPDGKTIAASGLLANQHSMSGGAVLVWNADTGKLRYPPVVTRGGYTNTVSFSPDSRTIGVTVYNEDAILLDARTGHTRSTLLHSGGYSSYTGNVAFSRDGTRVATSQWDGTIRIWDARTGAQEKSIPDPSQGVVSSVSWSADDHTIAATDWSQTLRLFDVASGQQIGTAVQLVASDQQIDPWGQYTPDGSAVVVSGNTAQTWVLPTSLSALSNEACRVANRNFSAAEWTRYVPGHPYREVCPGLPRG